MSGAAHSSGKKSRKRGRDSEGAAYFSGPYEVPAASDYPDPPSAGMAKRRMTRRASGRSRVSRRRSGGYRRRGRRAATYTPPSHAASRVSNRSVALVERRTMTVQRTLNPFPPTWKGHLTYGVSATRTTPANVDTSGNYVFAMNGMYDPDITSVGHQPYQFDQMCSAAGPYLNYIVLGFSYSLKFDDPSADGLIVGVAWRGWADSTGNPLNKTLAQIIEQGRNNYKTIANTGSQCADFSGYVDLPSNVGLTPDQYVGAAHIWGGLYNGNPSARQDFYVWYLDPAASAGIAFRVTGWIRYHCIFTNLVTLPQS